MRTYEKPFVMVTNDLAEGVYAASGQGNGTSASVTTPGLKVRAKWNPIGDGQADFLYNFGSLAGKNNAKMIVVYSSEVVNAWTECVGGDNAAASHQGNTVTFTWNKAPTSVCVVAQVAKDVEKLSVASISISAD